MLEFRGVCKREGGETHLDGIDLQLRPGEVNLLLGPARAGKTSLMRVAAGLEDPDSGSILFRGEDITRMSPRRRPVAMVYQQFINYPSATVFDNIASPLVAAKASSGEIRRRVGEAADLLRLGPFLQRLPGELSGGQQQRVALARALAKNAGFVLLDEPLANLDYKLREELRQELPRLFAGGDSVLVYATAEPEEALLLGGFVAVMDEGRVIQSGDAASAFRQPASLRAAGIFSDPPLNTAVARKRGEKFILAGQDGDVAAELPARGDAAAAPDGEYTLAFRPHHLLMDDPGAPAIRFSATVQIAEIAGSESFIRARAAGCDWIARAPGVHAPEIGAVVDMYLDPARVMAFNPDGAPASAGEDGRG